MAHVLEPSPEVVEGIVGKLKTNGMFDEMRRDCLADIDTKPAFQNLKQRVENYVNALLSTERWTPAMNKNQLRSKVRTSVMRSGMLNTGIEHILHQVVDAKMYTQFLPKISDFISENSEALQQEFAPVPDIEMPEENDEVHVDGNESPVNAQSPVNPEPPDVQEEDVEDIKENEEAKEESPPETEDEVPVIPEGAASTLRTLLQSLLTSDIHSLFTTDQDKADGSDGANRKDENSHHSSTGNSPSIDPSQIEAFTDDEADKVGPRTPEELDGDSPPSPPEDDDDSSTEHPPQKEDMSHSDNEESASSSAAESDEEIEEELGKVDSDASVNSGPPSDANESSDEVEVADDDYNDVAVNVEENVESFSYEEGQVNVVDVNEAFEEMVEEVEVVEYAAGEAVYDEECVVVDNQVQDLQEISAEAEIQQEDEIEETQHHSRGRDRSERKRRHKKHRRRRHSTSEEDSDLSGRASTPTERGSSEEAGSDDVEVVRSRSRKKKKKSKKKKHKHSKSKIRDSSQDKVQWESSSEYRRSSLSPVHPEMGQRHFVPSPQSHSNVRFEDDKRAVKVEPVFMSQIPPRFRDPYAIDHRNMEGSRPPMGDIERPFPMGPHDEPRMGFPMRPSYPPRSPPHFIPHMHSRFSPPRFPPNHPRFSPPYSRGPPFHMHPNSPPHPRRYSPTFDFFRGPMRPGFEPPGPPRSPPHNRRFSPPRQMGRFPGGMPPPRPFPAPPPDERFMPRPGGPGPHGMPPGPMMPPGPPMDMRRPPMR